MLFDGQVSICSFMVHVEFCDEIFTNVDLSANSTNSSSISSSNSISSGSGSSNSSKSSGSSSNST